MKGLNFNTHLFLMFFFNFKKKEFETYFHEHFQKLFRAFFQFLAQATILLSTQVPSHPGHLQQLQGSPPGAGERRGFDG